MLSTPALLRLLDHVAQTSKVSPSLMSVDRHCSEKGGKWFRRTRFQTPNLVSYFDPHRVAGRELSKLFSGYDMRVRELIEFVAELTELATKLIEFSSPRQCSQNCIETPFKLSHEGTPVCEEYFGIQQALATFFSCTEALMLAQLPAHPLELFLAPSSWIF